MLKRRVRDRKTLRWLVIQSDRPPRRRFIYEILILLPRVRDATNNSFTDYSVRSRVVDKFAVARKNLFSTDTSFFSYYIGRVCPLSLCASIAHARAR